MGWDAGWASWRRWRLSQRTWDTAIQEGRERLVVLGELPFTGGSHFSDDCFNEAGLQWQQHSGLECTRGFVEGNGGFLGGKRLFIQPGRSEYQVSALILEMPGCNLLYKT